MQEVWDERCNIRVMETPENGTGEISDVTVTENFSKLMTDTNLRLQKAQRASRRVNGKESTLSLLHLNLRKPKTKRKP